MSLLPATSHANPTTPFWATAGSGGGGGGSAPILIAGNTNNGTFTFPGDGTTDITIQDIDLNAYGGAFFPDGYVDGTFIINASWSVDGEGLNNTFKGAVFEATSSATTSCLMDTTDYPHRNVCGSVNLMYLFDFTGGGDIPVFQLNIINFNGTQTASGTATWSIVFYPTTQAVPYPI